MSVVKNIISSQERIVIVMDGDIRLELSLDAGLTMLAFLVRMYESGVFAEVDLHYVHKTIIETNCARIAESNVHL